MRTKPKSRISVITLGCSKNVVDSELLMAQLKANQLAVSADEKPQKGDTVIINTCGFINDAKEESIDTILHYIDAKKKGGLSKVFVMGCLSQRYKNTLLKEIPEIDAIFGVNEQHLILKTLDAEYKKELVGERHLTTPSHYAYLKISEGCDRQCSFCAIPIIRGKHISRPENDILHEARLLAAKGVKELILIAQDLTWYGLDTYQERRLPALVEKLAKTGSFEWIRLHYTYPDGFPLELINVIKDNPVVANYIDIPVQHISDTILRSMRRNITGKQIRELLDRIRSLLPDAALRTTLITGYPGETDHDFDELVNFVKEYRFDRLGVFTYSHEEDTPAYRLNDNIPEKVKQHRSFEIMQEQEYISYELNSKRIGNIYKVLIDREEGNYYIGRTEYDSPEIDNEVLLSKNEQSLNTGHFYNVLITGNESHDLYGTSENKIE